MNDSNQVAPSPPPQQKRRVVITLDVDGSADDAQAVQDAIGEAIDDEFLGPIVSAVVQRREIANVDWVVKGERWQDGPAPTPAQIQTAMEELSPPPQTDAPEPSLEELALDAARCFDDHALAKVASRRVIGTETGTPIVALAAERDGLVAKVRNLQSSRGSIIRECAAKADSYSLDEQYSEDYRNGAAMASRDIRDSILALATTPADKENLIFARAPFIDGANRIWPLSDVLATLVTWSEHLANHHNCDCEGYETLLAAAREANRYAVETLKQRAAIVNRIIPDWIKSAAANCYANPGFRQNMEKFIFEEWSKSHE